jgi:hypothetical protein
MLGIVDRTQEDPEVGQDSVVKVTFQDGFECRFWVPGLHDDEYVQRAEMIRELENQPQAGR